MKLGIHFTCFNEIAATVCSIESAKKVYPEAKVRLFSELEDFSFLEDKFCCVKTSVEKDTLTDTRKITDKNFLQESHQKSIYEAAKATLTRLQESCEYCESDYIVMLDPDAIIRSKLNIPENSKILGSKINKHLPLGGINKILNKIPGAIEINSWGATPGIFHVETLKKGLTFFEKNDSVLKDLCKEVYAIYAHDLLLPIVFASQGHGEEFNPDITECYRDADWRTNGKPLLHQFKDLYI